jgi:integral membrane protein
MCVVCGMEENQNADIKSTILVGHIEGISFLALLLIAMPLKHFFNMPLAVTIVGSIHGILFIAFLWQLFNLFQKKIWGVKKCAWALLLSILPAGTFFLK